MAYPNPIPPNTVFEYKTTDPVLELAKLRLSQIGVELARLQLEHALNQQAWLKAYNPNQPRLPAGQTGGGRWTSDFSTAEPATPQPDAFLRLAAGISKDEESWTVQQFMSAHCRGDIRAEMPGEFLNIPIADVMTLAKGGSAKANRCLKLLKREKYRK
jgi:hypothetical protein